MNVNELLEQCETDGIVLSAQAGQLQITGNLKKLDELTPIIRQHKKDIIRLLEQKDRRTRETVRYMQAEIALFHGEAVTFIARHIRTQYGKTYWQAQGEALTVWNILRRNQIRQALKDGRDDAAERLLAECREKFGMPDYLATSRAKWPESFSFH